MTDTLFNLNLSYKYNIPVLLYNNTHKYFDEKIDNYNEIIDNKLDKISILEEELEQTINQLFLLIISLCSLLYMKLQLSHLKNPKQNTTPKNLLLTVFLHQH